MNCTNCFAQITDGQKFCKKCGTPVPPPAPAVQSQEPPPTVTQPSQPQAVSQYPPQAPVYPTAQYPAPQYPPFTSPPGGKKSGGKKAGIAVTVIILLLGVMLGGHFLDFYTLPFLPKTTRQGDTGFERGPKETPAGNLETPSPSPVPSPTPEPPDLFADGTYIGEYDSNGKRSGYGTGIYHNYRYEGYWENDMPNGEGVLGAAAGQIIDRQPDANYAEVGVVHAYWIDGLAYGTVSLTWHMEDGQVYTWVFDVYGGYPVNEESVDSYVGEATLSLTRDWLVAGVPPWSDIDTDPEAPAPHSYFLGHFEDPSSIPTPTPPPAQFIELNMDVVRLIGQTSGYLYQENGDSVWSGMTRDGPVSEYMDAYVKYPFSFYMDTEKDYDQIIDIANTGGPNGNWPDNLTVARIEAWNYDWWSPRFNMHLLFDANIPLTFDNMLMFFDLENEWFIAYDPDDWFGDGYDHDIWGALFVSDQYAIIGEFYEKDGEIVMFRAEVSSR